jgi:hypothetical protein
MRKTAQHFQQKAEELDELINGPVDLVDNELQFKRKLVKFIKEDPTPFEKVLTLVKEVVDDLERAEQEEADK